MGKPLVRFCEGQECNCDMEVTHTVAFSHGSLLSTRKCWSKTDNLSVWIKGFRVNFHYFSINILIGSRDNDAFMTIMTLPNARLSLFDIKEPFKTQNTTS